MVAVTDRPPAPPGRSTRRRVGAWAFLLLFAAAVLVRLPGLGDPPSQFQTVRQYYTAIHAQAIADPWLDRTGAQRRADRVAAVDVFQLEAPVQSYLVAAGWIAAGGTPWWWPRLISICGYLLGGVAVARLLSRRAGRVAALAGSAVYLFLPFGLELSRSIQPDAVMVGLTCLAVDLADRLVDRPSWRRAATFALVASMAGLVKGAALFAVAPVIVLLLARREGRAKLRDRRVVVPMIATLVVVGVYYVPAYLYGDLRTQGESSIVPSLLLHPRFYADWWSMLFEVVGVAGAVGLVVALARGRGPLRAVIAGWTVGYVAFALLYDYRSATHNYYAALLLPAAALVAGAIVGHLEASSDAPGTASTLRFVAVVVLMIGLADWPFSPLPVSTATDPSAAAAVGRAARHATDVVLEAPDYGYPLMFDGHVAGFAWPGPADLALDRLRSDRVPSAAERLESMRRQGARDVVFVGRPSDWDPQLVTLVDRYPTLGSGHDWKVVALPG